MPHWKCGTCGRELGQSQTQPTCWNTKNCKGGTNVFQFTPTIQAMAINPDVNAEGAAAELGYAKDNAGSVRTNYDGVGSHKPGGDCFIHSQGKFAISRDGSTHSGGMAAWKGFKKTGNKWIYLGSYDNGLHKADRGGTGKQKMGEAQLPTS